MYFRLHLDTEYVHVVVSTWLTLSFITIQILKRCAEYPEKFETTFSDQLMSKHSLILPIRDEVWRWHLSFAVVHTASNVKVQCSMFIRGVYEVYIVLIKMAELCQQSLSPGDNVCP